jgi:hypothetical protein
LFVLGQRESGTEKLEQAIAAYNEALIREDRGLTIIATRLVMDRVPVT